MISTPSPNGSNGRDGNGRFAKGWRSGSGNPYARRVAALRQTVLDAVGAEGVTEIVGGLVAAAKSGDVAVAKRVHVVRAIFKRAVRWGLIPSSPFADLRAGSQSNPDRAFHVAPESIRAIMAACPDDQWRAVVALSRFAGLRCPSEIVALRWGDVNWERGRLMVRSPKTAGHEGHAVRVVPIAPELRSILQDLLDHALVRRGSDYTPAARSEDEPADPV
jgi:integrase